MFPPFGRLPFGGRPSGMRQYERGARSLPAERDGELGEVKGPGGSAGFVCRPALPGAPRAARRRSFNRSSRRGLSESGVGVPVSVGLTPSPPGHAAIRRLAGRDQTIARGACRRRGAPHQHVVLRSAACALARQVPTSAASHSGGQRAETGWPYLRAGRNPSSDPCPWSDRACHRDCHRSHWERGRKSSARVLARKPPELGASLEAGAGAGGVVCGPALISKHPTVGIIGV